MEKTSTRKRPQKPEAQVISKKAKVEDDPDKKELKDDIHLNDAQNYHESENGLDEKGVAPTNALITKENNEDVHDEGALKKTEETLKPDSCTEKIENAVEKTESTVKELGVDHPKVSEECSKEQCHTTSNKGADHIGEIKSGKKRGNEEEKVKKETVAGKSEISEDTSNTDASLIEQKQTTDNETPKRITAKAQKSQRKSHTCQTEPTRRSTRLSATKTKK